MNSIPKVLKKDHLFESVEQGNIEVDLNLKNNEKKTVFEIATRLKNVCENISQIILNQMEENVMAENRSCGLYILGMSLVHCQAQP